MINKSRLIKLTQKVISYDSQNPPGNELELGKFIEKDMRSLGLDVKIYNYAKNRPNIIATLRGSLPRKEAAAKSVLLTPHYDTVPYGKGWKFDPLGGKISQGRIYGRGSTDDKGNLASTMEVMRSFVEDGFRPRKDIIAAITADEETGSHYGIVPLLEKKVLQPGFGVILDSTEFDAVVAQKGLIHGRIQIFGRRAHGAYNWRGVNAIEIAARVINRLVTMKYPFKKHKLLHPPTMNIGVIKGGDKVNIVCDFCEFAFDTRYLPGTKAQDVLDRIHQEIKKETKNYKIEIDDLQQPYEIEASHPAIKAYMDTCKKMKCKAQFKGSEGATVISFFKKLKIPAFATGWGAHEQAHCTDEFIEIDTLYRGTKVLEEYVKTYDKI